MIALAQLLEFPLPSATEVVRELQHIPSAPKVLPRLSRLLEDGNTAIHDIVSLIRLDPGIAARVLQVANSVYYSKGSRIHSVDEAVVRVGYNQVYEMVSTAVASQVFSKPLTVYGLEADEVWRQSVACAMASEILASLVGADRGIAYTVGLLHNVGMVAINEWAMLHLPVLLFTHRGHPAEYIESERSLIGFTMAEAGAELLESWDFPQDMANPVRWQYTPQACLGQAQQAALLHAARWVRTSVCSEDLAPPPPDPASLRPLRLTPAHLSKVAIETRLRLISVRHLLELA